MVTSRHGHVQVERTGQRVVHASLCASNFVGAINLFIPFSSEGSRVLDRRPDLYRNDIILSRSSCERSRRSHWRATASYAYNIMS